jgi:hypothetical protein
MSTVSSCSTFGKFALKPFNICVTIAGLRSLVIAPPSRITDSSPSWSSSRIPLASASVWRRSKDDPRNDSTTKRCASKSSSSATAAVEQADNPSTNNARAAKPDNLMTISFPEKRAIIT